MGNALDAWGGMHNLQAVACFMPLGSVRCTLELCSGVQVGGAMRVGFAAVVQGGPAPAGAASLSFSLGAAHLARHGKTQFCCAPVVLAHLCDPSMALPLREEEERRRRLEEERRQREEQEQRER